MTPTFQELANIHEWIDGVPAEPGNPESVIVHVDMFLKQLDGPHEIASEDLLWDWQVQSSIARRELWRLRYRQLAVLRRYNG